MDVSAKSQIVDTEHISEMFTNAFNSYLLLQYNIRS